MYNVYFREVYEATNRTLVLDRIKRDQRFLHKIMRLVIKFGEPRFGI